LLDAIQPRVIIVADSELPATARASERLKERLTRRNALVIHTRDAGAVKILFRPAGIASRKPSPDATLPRRAKDSSSTSSSRA
jgi:hypothetical protein